MSRDSPISGLRCLLSTDQDQTPLIAGSAHLKLRAPTLLVAVWSKPEDKNDSRIYISLCLKSEIINYLQWTFGQFDDTDILGVEKTSFCKN